MQTSQQPQLQAGPAMHSTRVHSPSAGYPRTGGYGPMGHAINRTHQQQQQQQQKQPFPPPPPPQLPPPPGFFPSPTPPSPSPPTFQSPPLSNTCGHTPPSDFTLSQTHWDTRTVFGLDLPRFVKRTPHTESNRTAGMPITDITLLHTIRHSWNSYWLRYIAHGYSTGMLFTKHINESMFASEFFSVLRAKEIDLDAAAIAYCHPNNIPTPTKQKALGALVAEFVDYLQDVCEERGAASSARPEDSQRPSHIRPPHQPDPATAQRITALEHQLAAATLTINHLRGKPTPQPSQPFTHNQPPATTSQQPPPSQFPQGTAQTDEFSPIAPRNIQQQIDSLERKLAVRKHEHSAPANQAPSVVDITALPTRLASQETTLYSPSPNFGDKDRPTELSLHHKTPSHTLSQSVFQPTQASQHTTFDAPVTTTAHAPATTNHNNDPNPNVDRASKNTPTTKSKRAVQLGSNPTLLKNKDNPHCHFPPTGTAISMAQWCQHNFTDVHIDSGIIRWFGSLKNFSDKQKADCKSYISEVLQAYPEITHEQRQQLDANAASWGIPIRLIQKLQARPLMRLLSIIATMTE